MIDKRLLIDEVQVFLKFSAYIRSGPDGYGKEKEAEPILLKPVRFDRSVSVSGSSNTVTRQKVGTVFVYPNFCDVTIDDSWLGARLSDGVRDYIVQGYTVNRLFSKAVFSYEIEVI